MQHPVIASANAKVRYHELVQEADLYRQTRFLKPSNPGFVARALSYVVGVLRPLNTKAIRTTVSNTTA
jgi:hypothetical protein